MRTALLATSLLVATAAAARADVVEPTPELTTEAVPAARTQPLAYVETGAMAGANARLLTLAATLDAGYHLENTALWFHVRVAAGAGGELFATGNGSMTQVRAGVELRSCAFDGVLCAMAGVDLGYQHTSFTGHDDSWFSDETSPDMTTVTTEMIAVPRVGLDVGGRVRFRPGLELDVGPRGVDGANATLALALQW